MRLRALELDRFKKFDRPIRISGIEDGLNLIAGPNEMGKSTLLAALNAVLFEKHGSKSRSITDFQPRRHDTAPWVALDFEVEGRAHRIEKRFLKRPSARLSLPGGRVVEGDAAEHELRRLLGLYPAGARGQADIGLWRLLLIGQGQSLVPPEVDGSARHTLQQALETELGSLTGSESAKALIRRIDAELHALIDRRGGRPKGHYREVAQALEAAAAEIARLEQERDALAQDLADLDSTRERLNELARAQPADKAKDLNVLEARREAMLAARHAAAEAEAAQERARRELADIEAEQRARQQLVARHEAALRRRDEARIAVGDAQQGLEAREAEGSARKADRERLAAEHAGSAAQVQKLDALASMARERARIAAALADVSPEVAFTLAPEALARVRIDRHPLPSPEETRVVAAPLDIAIEGIGRIGVHPPAGLGRLRAEQERLEARIHELLRQLGLSAGDGAGGRLPDPAVIETALARARELLERLGGQLEAASARLDQAREAWRDARASVQAAQVARAQADEQLTAVERELATRRDRDSDGQLAARLEQQRAALDAADRQFAASGGVDREALAALEQEIAERRQTLEAQRTARHELEKRLERLSAQIEAREGAGLTERIEEQRRIEAGLERERQALARDVEVLGLLRATLEEAEREAKERYLAPLLERIRPHLEALWPGAAVVMDEDFRITELHREVAGDEPFAQLSEGTREQIAVLARIACAELLAEHGLPAVLVLDDALVFCDDERLERMFEILERAAGKLQIIVLTCRERVFRDLNATRLRLEQAQYAS